MASEARKAHGEVWRAVRAGRLPRPEACQRCGRECVPHGHHADYARPLDVKWLCTACHGAEHRRLRDEFAGFACPRCGDLVDGAYCPACAVLVF